MFWDKKTSDPDIMNLLEVIKTINTIVEDLRIKYLLADRATKETLISRSINAKEALETTKSYLENTLKRI